MRKIDLRGSPITIHPAEPVFTSGVVSRLTGIPTWVLKELDRAKIICPERPRGHDRLYSHQELGSLKHIWYLMEKRKVTIHGVKVILEIESGNFKEE